MCNNSHAASTYVKAIARKIAASYVKTPFREVLDHIEETALIEIVIELRADGRVQATGTIRSDIPVHAIKLFDDPPGNGDYNALAHAALPDEKTGAFEIISQPLDTKGDHVLRLVLFHVNGRWTQFKSAMTIDASGKVDLTRANRDLGKR